MCEVGRPGEVGEIVDTGKGEVTGMRLRDLTTGAETLMAVSGVFVAIGHTPNTSLFAQQLELDVNGYIVTHDGAKTSVALATLGEDGPSGTYQHMGKPLPW